MGITKIIFGFDSPEPEPASESELSSGRPYHGLPDEILDKIVRYAVESDLTLIGLFNRMDEKFKTIVSRYYPRIYVNPYLLEKLSLKEISIKMLSKTTGRGSGVMHAIRSFFSNNQKWHNGWIQLEYDTVRDWYLVVDFYLKSNEKSTREN